MQAFLRRGASLLSSSSSLSSIASRDRDSKTDGFQTASSYDALFAKVDPAVDGEECLHDCDSCSVHLPAKFEIDVTDKIYGHVKGWSTHLVVATGKTDWVRDVADEKGSLMEAIEKGSLRPSNGRLKLSASNMPVPDEYHSHPVGEQPTNVLLLPSFTIVEQVTPHLAPDLIRQFVNPAPTTTTPLERFRGGPVTREILRPPAGAGNAGFPPPPDCAANATPLRSRPCPHAAVILLCSQRTRDARCGQSAPLLKREFERHLRALGLYRDMSDERPGGVGIYFISHVGGHKYAANVIVYRRRDFDWWRKKTTGSEASEGKVGGRTVEHDSLETVDEGAAQGIWLARVRPEDCENIVRFTVLKGKVVKPASQLRGGFDRERSLISW